jgi:hypothetical protein
VLPARTGEAVYVTDNMRCRVIKCSVHTGKMLLAGGRSGREEGNFEIPYGVALADTASEKPVHRGGARAEMLGGAAAAAPPPPQPDADGEVYDDRPVACAKTLFVSDKGNHRIVALDASDLSFRFMWGHYGPGDYEFIEPSGIAVHGNRLLVADGGNQRLCVYSLRGEFVRCLGPDGPGSFFTHRPTHVALTADAAFCIENTVEQFKVDARDKEKVPGKIHVLDPNSGAVLRPPMQPPFAMSPKNHSNLSGIGVFHGALWVSSAAGVVMKLPRAPSPDAAKGAAKGTGAVEVS